MLGSSVCFFSFCAAIGGISTYQALHLSYLLGQHVKVTLIDEFPRFTLSRLTPSEIAQASVITAPVWSSPSTASAVLLDYCAQNPLTIVLVTNPALLWTYRSVLRQARRDTGARIVVTNHSLFEPFTARRIIAQTLCAIESPLMAQEIVYVSEFTRRSWEQWYPWLRGSRYRIVPNGVRVPANVSRPQPPPALLRVAYVGQLSPVKDPRLFCRVAQLANDRQAPFEFHAYGDGPLGTSLRREYAEFVHWHGLVSSAREIFSEADLLLLTSQVENCPLALLEAKSYCVPAVALAVGGVPEIVTEGRDGYLVRQRNPELALLALERARQNYDSLRCGCEATRHRYDMSEVGKQMWQVYL